MPAPISRRLPPNIGVRGPVGRTPSTGQHPPIISQRAVSSDVAPVCPITRGEVPPSQPGIKVPFVPKANDLPSAIDAINKIIDIIATDTTPSIRWLEKYRVTAIVRITNPDDDTQWIDVERIQQLMMEDQITGDLWFWELTPPQPPAPGRDPGQILTQQDYLTGWQTGTIVRPPGY